MKFDTFNAFFNCLTILITKWQTFYSKNPLWMTINSDKSLLKSFLLFRYEMDNPILWWWCYYSDHVFLIYIISEIIFCAIWIISFTSDFQFEAKRVYIIVWHWRKMSHFTYLILWLLRSPNFLLECEKSFQSINSLKTFDLYRWKFLFEVFF